MEAKTNPVHQSFILEPISNALEILTDWDLILGSQSLYTKPSVGFNLMFEIYKMRPAVVHRLDPLVFVLF